MSSDPDTSQGSNATSRSGGSPVVSEREKRRAEALRRNLRLRKAAARTGEDEPPAERAPGAE